MKMVKNIVALSVAASFMFGGLNFHLSNQYTSLDDATTITQGWGATFDLNENTGIGWDDNLGMLMYFEVPAGVSLRLSSKGNDTGIGLGYTWWTGGAGLKTSISTAYDQIMDNQGVRETSESLTMTVGFGF